MILVLCAILLWLLGWWVNARLASGPYADTQLVRFLAPLIFGLTIIGIWELVVRGLEVPLVILPPPSVIAVRFADSLPILWADLLQTIINRALGGYVIGCGSAFLMAIAAHRWDFLRLGLLQVRNFVAALPIVGTAPTLVMWFRFDWHSRAAEVGV